MPLLDRLQYRNQSEIQGESRVCPQIEVNQNFIDSVGTV